jgi:hypothetical protein
LGEGQAKLQGTEKAIKNLQAHAKQVADQKKELEPWRKLSLPGNKTFSQLKYSDFLGQMLEKCHVIGGEVKPAADNSMVFNGGTLPSPDRKETPPYRALSFTVKGHGDLTQVVQLLEEFYRTPLLHKIKKLTIKRASSSGLAGPRMKGGTKEDLDFELAVEAIIVTGAEDRSDLRPPKATVHTLARTSRDYLAITGKDPFYPPPPPLQKQDGPDPARAIRLTMITRDAEQGCMAVLYDEASKSSCYLCPKTGYVRFQIKGKPGQFELVQVDEAGGKIVFSADDKHYALPLDQTVAEALGRPLSVAQVRAMELTKVDNNNGPR